MEQTVDLCTAAQLQRVDHGGTAALDRPLEILLKLLDAPEKGKTNSLQDYSFNNKGKFINDVTQGEESKKAQICMTSFINRVPHFYL